MTTHVEQLSRHEAAEADLNAAESSLLQEQSRLIAKRSELAPLAILDKSPASRQELSQVTSRLNEISNEFEILRAARSALEERLARTRHEIALDERGQAVERVMFLASQRDEMLSTIEAATKALSQAIGQLTDLNLDGQEQCALFTTDEQVVGLFSNKRLRFAIKRLFGKYFLPFNIMSCLRPGHGERSWVDSTRTPPDWEAHLRSLPVK